MAEVRAEDAALIPEGFEALGHRALAARLGLTPRAARARLSRLAAQQRDPEVLRVVEIPVLVGKGARRRALHVLWPRTSPPPCQPCQPP